MSGLAVSNITAGLSLEMLASHELGWEIISSPASGSYAQVHRYRQRLRAVIAEPLDSRHAPRLRALHVRARDLFARGVSAEDSADLLCGPARDLGAQAQIAFAVTVIDMDGHGYANIACQYSPPVLRSGPDRLVGLLPLPRSSEPAPTTRLHPGERLIASTGSLLGGLSPKTLAQLPALARNCPDAKTILTRLVGSRDSASAEVDAAALVIATRTRRAGQAHAAAASTRYIAH